MENLIAFLESYGSIIAWCVAIGLSLALGVLAYVNHKKGRFDARMIAFASISIAMSMILNLLPAFSMPNGGSITVARLLPLVAFAYIFGFGPGCIAGCIYGLLDFMMKPYFVHPVQFLLDYPLAFAGVGFAGIQFFKSKKGIIWSLVLGTVITGVSRWVFSTTSGVLYWEAELWYSITYNSVLLADTAVCLAVVLLVFTSSSLTRLMESQKPSYRKRLF